MKIPISPPTDVGVIVARFHAHELHAGHVDLIETVLARHSRVFIFLGLSPLPSTLNNPLPFKDRKAMIKEKFGNKVEIFFIDDVPSNDIWSKNLDRSVSKWLNPRQTVTLYGSRDSFIKYYSGKFPTCELQPELFISATQIRRDIINNYPSSKDYRAGLIAATGLRYPTSYQAVDIAIYNDDGQVLMAKKPNETKFRFIGGFADPNSESLEADARREVQEEAGIEISDPKYMGSLRVNDWRYANEQDKIKTVFFLAKYIFGNPEGADDIELVKWFNPKDLSADNVVVTHLPLLEMFKNNTQHILQWT